MDAVFEACPSLELFECDVGVKIDSRFVYFSSDHRMGNLTIDGQFVFFFTGMRNDTRRRSGIFRTSFAIGGCGCDA